MKPLAVGPEIAAGRSHALWSSLSIHLCRLRMERPIDRPRPITSERSKP